MPRTAAVDRPDFHAWRAYRAVVDAEAAPVQIAMFRFEPEGRGRRGVWIHGGPTSGVRIGAVYTATIEYSDPANGAVRRRRTYTAVADAAMGNGTTSPAPPTIEGLDSRSAAAALLYGRWIERRARLAVGKMDSPGFEPGPAACKAAVLPLTPQAQGSGSRIRTGDLGCWRPAGTAELPHPAVTIVAGEHHEARTVLHQNPGVPDYGPNPGVQTTAAEPHAA